MTDETENLLYLGKRVNSKGKLVHAFCRQKDDETYDLESFIYWEKTKDLTFLGAKIGRIYEFSSGIFPKFWSDAKVGELPESLCADLQIKHQMSIKLKQSHKGSSTPELDAALKIMRQARWKMSKAQQSQFDVWVLNEMRKYSS